MTVEVTTFYTKVTNGNAKVTKDHTKVTRSWWAKPPSVRLWSFIFFVPFLPAFVPFVPAVDGARRRR